MTTFDGICENPERTLAHFALALTVSDILKLYIFYLQTGQGHFVQFSH